MTVSLLFIANGELIFNAYNYAEQFVAKQLHIWVAQKHKAAYVIIVSVLLYSSTTSPY